jgi:ribonuclease PH
VIPVRAARRSSASSVARGKLVGPTGPMSLVCDCDVIEADGGTRTASITGAWVALELAFRKLRDDGRLPEDPTVAQVAATSVGLVGDPPEALLDLAYVEDAAAVVDLNVVALQGKGLVEVQGTGEHGTFSRRQLDVLLDLAEAGMETLFATQRAALGGAR